MGRLHGRKNNDGFTLIEIIIAIAMLAIISVPILGNFVNATKLNQEARIKQKATLAGQQVMEDMLAKKDVDAIARDFDVDRVAEGWKEVSSAAPDAAEVALADKAVSVDATTDETIWNVAKTVNDTYYFARPVKMKGTEFQAVITLTPSEYAVGGAKKTYVDSNMTAENGISVVYYNAYEMPKLKSIYTTNNVVAVEEKDIIDSQAYSTMVTAYIKEQRDAGNSVSQTDGEDAITNAGMKREMYIKLSPAAKSNYIIIDVFYRYTCLDSSVYADEVDISLQQEEYAACDLENIYLFYSNYSETKDYVHYEVDSALASKMANEETYTINGEEYSYNKINLYLMVEYEVPGVTDESILEGYKSSYKLQFETTADLTIDTIYDNISKKGEKGGIVDVSGAEIAANADDIIETEKDTLRISGATIEIYYKDPVKGTYEKFVTMDSSKGD